eukprot:CAMPEP_0202978636 /NCGR_PEP_ID=MMETSP1396-20130829/84995_1 /ASSEMBLY_ACC=CAM_ASM_000872 /TAXON_ID= /ORGANISM="Pseudokeronopsis sp., Strain Brazil" /LENGTH=74 /DNA_ID=CAMNT_0049717677 /DNA_START=526 /DNA_END=750 /DNA_ORIENTATION=-
MKKTAYIFAEVKDYESAWAAFLEKVWAKAMGSYEMIDRRALSGGPAEVYDFFLNVPTSKYRFSCLNESMESCLV